jgi:hypothetical protein
MTKNARGPLRVYVYMGSHSIKRYIESTPNCSISLKINNRQVAPPVPE